MKALFNDTGKTFSATMSTGGNFTASASMSGSGGGTSFVPGNALELRDGVLNVLTASEPDPDNTLPITAAGVSVTVGNIESLLATI